MWNDDKPFTIYRLITRISELMMNYNTLSFANLRLYSYLEKEHSFPNVTHYYITQVAAGDKRSVGEFKGNEIIESVISYGGYCQTNYKETCGNLLTMNAHFIRTRIINAVYESIISFTQHHSNKKLMEILRSKNWFRILHMLRNIVSHFDNYNKPLSNWPKDYPNPLIWETIVIHKDQIGHTVRYDDGEIRDLLNVINKYFVDNTSTFL